MTLIQRCFWCMLFYCVMLSAMLSVILTNSTFAHAAIDRVEGIRLWHSPAKTRIVFDVSADVRQSMFTLQNPLRLVVDIQNASLVNQLPSLDPNNEHIAKIRSGTPKEGTLRFVFELKKELLPSNFVLSPNELYGHRLVVDLNERQQDSYPVENTPLLLPEPTNIELRKPKDSQKNNEEQTLHQTLDQTSEPRSTTQAMLDPQVDQANTQEQVARRGSIEPKPFIVAIDAGHGGEDPGAIGYRGTYEKKLTLSIAKRLLKRINQDDRMQAILIRTGDYYIKLHQRRQMARDQNADVFISIHADAFTKQSAQGFSVFALSQSGATSAMARALAAKENASDRIGGVSLADKDNLLAQVLVDLSMTNTISESVNLGGRVLQELGKIGKLHSKRVEQAGFAVLKSPDMPSILVETGFITNPSDERSLKTSRYQTKIANAIYQALSDYYQQTPYFSRSSYSNPSVNATQQTSKASHKKRAALTHTVKRGDSLSKISARYNVTINSLKRLNNLTGNTVRIGQKLRLPQGANVPATVKKPSVYRVRKGDNLSTIAKRFGVSLTALKRHNKLTKNTIYIGQKLTIP